MFIGPLLAIWRLIGVQGALIILGALAAIAGVWWLYDAGGDAREAKIAAQNERAERTKAAAAHDVTSCFALGDAFRWDVTTGKCITPSEAAEP